jgi:hypothetical protein
MQAAANFDQTAVSRPSDGRWRLPLPNAMGLHYLLYATATAEIAQIPQSADYPEG